MAGLLDDLTPEEFDAEYERRRARYEQTKVKAERVKQIRDAEAAGRLRDTAGANIAEANRSAALAGKVSDDKVAMVPSLAAPAPEDVPVISQRLNDRGDFAISQTPGKDYSEDIEGALAVKGPDGKPLNREITAGDQRLVVNKSGQAVATRQEAPSIPQHFDALFNGDTNAASKLGFAGNVLSGLARGAATGATYLDRAIGGGDVDVTNLPKDLWSAVKGEDRPGENDTVTEGGLVAKRGSGWGDFLRSRKKRLLDENPDATVKDLLLTPSQGANDVLRKGLAHLGSLISGQDADTVDRETLGALNPSTKLRDLSDNAMDAYGEVMSVPLDPLNLVPFAKGAEVAAKGARVAGLGPALDLGAKGIDQVVGHLPAGVFGRDARVAARARLAGESADDAVALARSVDEAVVRSNSEAASHGNEMARQAQDLMKSMESGDKKAVAHIAEQGLEALPFEERVAKLKEAAKAGTAKLTSEEIAAIENGQMAGREWELARKLDVDLFKPHALEQAGEEGARQVKAAKKLNAIFKEELEHNKRVGYMSGVGETDNYLPHVQRPWLASKIEAAGAPRLADFVERLTPISPDFDPGLRRTASGAVDAENFRVAAQAAIESGEVANAVKAGKITQKQADNIAAVVEKAKAAGQAQDPAVRAAAASAGADVPKMVRDLVDDPDGVLAARGKPEGQWTQDPNRMIAAGVQHNADVRRSARLVQLLKETRDTGGNRFLQSLDEAIVAPRSGADSVLRDRYFRPGVAGKFTRKPVAQSAVINGRTILNPDIAAHLEARGLEYVDVGSRLGTALPSLRGSVVPKAIVGELEDVVARMDPSKFDLIARAARAVDRLWIPLVLNTPVFHINNALFGFFQMFLGGGAHVFNPQIWAHAQQVAEAAIHGGDSIVTVGERSFRAADLLDMAKEYGVYEGGKAANLRSVVGKASTYADEGARSVAQRLNPFNAHAGIGPGGTPIFEAVLSRAPAAAPALLHGRIPKGTATMEDTQRLVLFLQQLGEGKTAIEASNTVRKFMFDYTGSSLSSTEKSFRKYVPFYQWIRYSTQQMVEQMLKQPHKYAAVNKLYNAIGQATRPKNYDPRETPDFVREQGLLPTSADDETMTFMGYDRPGAQLAPLADMLGSLGPLYGAGIERFTGDWNYGDQPIDPNFVQGAPQNSTLENVTGMHNELLPNYLLRKAGGIPGFLGQIALGETDYGPGNPRRSGSDALSQLSDRAIRFLGGPKTATVRPEDVLTSSRTEGGDVQKKEAKHQASMAKKRSAPRPLTDLIFGGKK